MANELGNFPFSDDLMRRRWVKQGMVAAGKTQFINKFKGRTFDSPIYQLNTGLQVGNKGNEIIFDFDGFLAQIPLEGDAQLSGTGENMKKFSASFYTRHFHNTTAIPKEWAAQEIGSMELRRTASVRDKLTNQYARIQSQAAFDVIQGFDENSKPSHIIMPNGKTDINDLDVTDRPSLDLLNHIIYSATTGEDMSVGDDRPGLKDWTDESSTTESKQVIDLLVDFYFLHLLNQDEGWRKLYGSLLVTTLQNPLLSGVVASHQNLRIHLAPRFQGYSIKRDINKSAVESAGFRRFDAVNQKWTGEKGFDNKSQKMIGTAAVIGAGAMISHTTLCPVDPFVIETTNHKQSSEASLHYYMNIRRTRLFEHNGDYAMRKMTGYDLGIININYHL